MPYKLKWFYSILNVKKHNIEIQNSLFRIIIWTAMSYLYIVVGVFRVKMVKVKKDGPRQVIC